MATPDRLSALFRTYHSRQLGDRAAAEEIAQETFVRALKQETIATEQSWIFAVATIFGSERLAWASTGERVVYALLNLGSSGKWLLARSMRARKSRKVVFVRGIARQDLIGQRRRIYKTSIYE